MDLKNLPRVEQVQFIQHKNKNIIYFSVLLICITAFIALPIIKIKVSVRANGIIRPVQERIEVKVPGTGIIKAVHFKEGDLIEAGKVLLQLTDQQISSRDELNNNDLIRCREYVHDLVLLTDDKLLSDELLSQLISSMYKEQLSRYLNQGKIHQTSLDKVKSEWMTDSILFNDKVISRKELYDKKQELEKIVAGYVAFIKDQQANWHQDLHKYSLQVEVTKSQQILYEDELKMKKVIAPVSGVIQQTGTRYVGSLVSSGEVVCIISPEVDIQGECYVAASDVGMLRVGQPVTIQVDAFDYNYFGAVSGKLLSIDNDFTLIDNKPVFKIKCSFNHTKLSLKNGFVGTLRKGLTFKIRLSIAERTLWQLLFDSVDDWLLPTEV
jgi:multidrug resistance efflux pump